MASIKPSLEFPPPVSPIVHSVREERDLQMSIARERPLWVDHVMPGLPLPRQYTHVPETRGLSRW